MPQFVMIGWDGPDGAQRRNLYREQHVAHVMKLRDEGKITLAGPTRDEKDEKSTGAVIIFRVTNLEEARALVDRDPYVAGGVFESFTINPFKQVIPEPS